MKHELTEKIKEWLDTPAADRDIVAGATMLLRIRHNRILFDNVVRRPEKYADHVEYELQKIYNARVQDITREQVRVMVREVEQIDAKVGLSHTAVNPRSEWQKGKRADHDSLPDEIRQKYVENADIMRRMRECHLHLRMITPQNSSCPDSDRYPFAKEIIALFKQYRSNWEDYDRYSDGVHVVPAVKEDPRDASKVALRLVNMNKGKYAKNRNPELADYIRAQYAKIIMPTESLTAELRALKIIE